MKFWVALFRKRPTEEAVVGEPQLSTEELEQRREMERWRQRAQIRLERLEATVESARIRQAGEK